MPRKCTICEHRSRKAIDRALLRNESHASISRRFKLSSDAVARHHHQHVENALHVAVEQKKQDARYGATLLEQLDDISRDCARLAALAEADKDVRGALLGIAQRLKIWESHAKLAGAFPAQAASVTVNLAQLNVSEAQMLAVAQTFIDRHRALPEPAAIQIVEDGQ